MIIVILVFIFGLIWAPNTLPSASTLQNNECLLVLCCGLLTRFGGCDVGTIEPVTTFKILDAGHWIKLHVKHNLKKVGVLPFKRKVHMRCMWRNSWESMQQTLLPLWFPSGFSTRIVYLAWKKIGAEILKNFYFVQWYEKLFNPSHETPYSPFSNQIWVIKYLHLCAFSDIEPIRKVSNARWKIIIGLYYQSIRSDFAY